jgi:AraC-like DNA-binding protein
MTPLAYQLGLLLSFSFSFFVSVLLCVYSKGKKTSGFVLSVFFFFLAYPVGLTFLIATGLILYVPHLYRTGLIFALELMPVSYLYVRSVLTPRMPTRKDLWHFIPSVVYVIDYLPFFFRSGEEKLEALFQDNLGLTIILFEESMVFPPGFYLFCRYAISLIYLIFQARLIWLVYRILSGQQKRINAQVFKWLTILSVSELSLIFPPLTLFGEKFFQFEPIIYFSMIGGVTVISAISLFFFPYILLGLKGIELNSGREEESKLQESLTHKFLTEKKISEIEEMVLSHFEQNKPYLRLQYSLSQAASELNLPVQYISGYINNRENENFNDFVNRYRIRHCQKLLEVQYYRKLKLESLAKECGFNNRNTFTIAFKKFVCTTPSKYIQIKYSKGGNLD